MDWLKQSRTYYFNNMKIAVCFSGHTRNYKHNYPNFRFDADVFIHTAWQSGLPNGNTQSFISYHFQDYNKTFTISPGEIRMLYSPKDFTIVDDHELPEPLHKFKGFKTQHGGKLDQIAIMFYNIYYSNELKRQYEITNRFKYDFVIRTRFDIKINELSINPSNLYLAKKDGTVNDLFFASNSDTMDKLSNCYLWLVDQGPETLSKYNSAEHILTAYINTLNLDIPVSNDFDILFNKDYPLQTLNIKNGEFIFTYNH
jgi:hypothetical protein